MFTRTAAFYDAIYSWKDYAAESVRLRELIDLHKRSGGVALLDVACGTAAHFPHLAVHYALEGIDLDPVMLEIARAKNPGVPFHCGDMIDFDLGRQFDIVTCLFSSIGYVRTVQRLNAAVSNLARHVTAGGLLIIEPWLRPHQVSVATPGHAVFVDRPELKIARMNSVTVIEGISTYVFHYLIGTTEGVEYATERHELGLFTHEQYVEAIRATGMDVEFDEKGLMGRGLYIGRRA